MNIFITGGTGFIGKHLVEALAKEGHLLYVLARDPKKAIGLAQENVTIIQGTIERPETYADVFARPIDAVYHLAAIPGEKWGWKEEDYDMINFRGTKSLLDMCEGKIRLFVFCSSINAIENRTGFHAAPYGKSKRQAESLVLEKKSFQTAIIRPAIVYGPGDRCGMLTQLCQMIRKRRFFLIGSGDNILPLVYIDDLVSAFVQTLGISQTAQIFEISGPESLSIREIAFAITRKVRRPLPPFHVPVWLARSAACFSENIFPLLGKTPFITQHRIDIVTKSNPIDSKKAREALKYRPKTTFSAGLDKTISWMKQDGYL